MGLRYPAVRLSPRTGMQHRISRSASTFRVIDSQCLVVGKTQCGIPMGAPLKIEIVDEESGTWCAHCGAAGVQLQELPPVLLRNETEWTNMYMDIVRAVTELMPDRCDRILAELAKRAPIKENASG